MKWELNQLYINKLLRLQIFLISGVDPLMAHSGGNQIQDFRSGIQDLMVVNEIGSIVETEDLMDIIVMEVMVKL